MACVTEPMGNSQASTATTTESAWTTTTSLNQQQTLTVTNSDSSTVSEEVNTVTGLQTPTGRPISRRAYMISRVSE